MERITSVHNNKIKEAAALTTTKGRKQSGLFIVEGQKLVAELVRCGIELMRVFVKEGAVFNVDNLGCEAFEVSESVLKKISAMETPQDVIAIAKMPNRTVDASEDFILALDAIQDPANMGAILRSAEAFGVKSVVLGNGCHDPYSQKTLRGAMGSVFRLNILQKPLKEYLLTKKEQGYTIIGAGLDKNYKTVDTLYQSQKKIIVIGNEGNGISDEVMSVCDFGMFIPMSGQNESLNAAVAASIIMWENKRQSEQ